MQKEGRRTPWPQLLHQARKEKPNKAEEWRDKAMGEGRICHGHTSRPSSATASQTLDLNPNLLISPELLLAAKSVYKLNNLQGIVKYELTLAFNLLLNSSSLCFSRAGNSFFFF